MTESPLSPYQKVVEETDRMGATNAKREAIPRVLMSRFGDAVKDLKVESDADEFAQLEGLLES